VRRFTDVRWNEKYLDIMPVTVTKTCALAGLTAPLVNSFAKPFSEQIL
jgi:hypothetical protein